MTTADGGDAPPERVAELAERLAALRERVRRACAAADRDPADVTMVVVTKTFPTADVRALASLGVRDVGESRHQEAVAKVAGCADLDLRWHLVGRLQSNKAAAVADYAWLVHSLDRAKVVDALSRGAGRAGRRVGVLVQVSLDGDPDRGGAVVDDVPGLADRVAGAEHLDLRGVMAVAPLGVDPRSAFDRLAAVSARVVADHPGAGVVSAGMSADLEAAVAAGATHLRVGSAVLGSRPVLG
jgi:PLP dependent protein